jgi:hypothetical protein
MRHRKITYEDGSSIYIRDLPGQIELRSYGPHAITREDEVTAEEALEHLPLTEQSDIPLKRRINKDPTA